MHRRGARRPPPRGWRAHVTHMGFRWRGPGARKDHCRACPPRCCWSILRRIKQEEHNILASPNSVKLFTAWAAKHKEVIAIEDRWNLAMQHDPATAETVRLELERAREEAQRLLARARSIFHEELRARGIRE